MDIVLAFILVLVAGMVLVLAVKEKWKNSAMYTALLLNSLLTAYQAVISLSGQAFSILLPGNLVTGPIPVQVDSLSAWFILIINIVFLTGGYYGIWYMKAYKTETNKLMVHRLMFLLLHASLLLLCTVQNSLIFLIGWELMTISAFMTVIFEHEKNSVIKAGMNFLIQSHISLVFLMLGFIWVAAKTGSYDFEAIRTYASGSNHAVSLGLMLCFMVGFGIKAGFVPFHTWLPYAHPAAPAHISGIMSGVIIKIGIFGILRMLLIIPSDYTTIGYILLFVSVISGVYGVMLAIMQHNLKKLLAYHSIENIGIIGIGLGIGCVGLGAGNHMLASLGFAGALLHTMNHALFKSLLFYTAGNVYSSTHTLHVEHLGGIIKKMPHTALLFLVASIAISGIPPFNGFISEFLIYSGLYNWLHHADLVPLVAVIFSILGLVLIGGLALMCFTKAFGVVFLGTPRHELHHEVREVPMAQRIPLYLLAFLIALIGLFPQMFLSLLEGPVALFTTNPVNPGETFDPGNVEIMRNLSLMGGGFLGLVALVWWLRIRVTKGRKAEVGPTWGCGYVAPNSRQQYTAGSFVRSYSKLFRGLLMSSRREKGVEGIFPTEGYYESHSYDKLENFLIDKPILGLRYCIGRFSFLQNGRLQVYILYGIIFIALVIIAPLVFEKMRLMFEFLKQM